MRLRSVFNKRLLAVSGGAVVVALAAGGIAYASTPSGPTTASAPAATAAKASTSTVRVAGGKRYRRLVRLARHTVHADLIVRTRNGYRTIEVDRGTLKSETSATITIVRPDGPTVSATLTSKTRYVGLTQSQLVPGDRVLLVQTGGNALAVRARSSSDGP